MEITGRLTHDAKVNTVSGDRQVVNFTVAVNDSYKNKTGEWVQLTEYYRCAYWLTTKIANALAKGRLVQLTGWASSNAWVDQNGEARAAMNFHTSKVKFLDAARQQQPQTVGDGEEMVKDDLPF